MRIFLWIACAILFPACNGENLDKENQIQISASLGPIDRNKLMPNLFFFGVSKCGTSTTARLLTEHPLVTAVGGKAKNVWAESTLMQQRSPLKGLVTVQTDRVAQNLRSKNDSTISEILRYLCGGKMNCSADVMIYFRYVFHYIGEA